MLFLIYFNLETSKNMKCNASNSIKIAGMLVFLEHAACEQTQVDQSTVESGFSLM